MLTLSVRDEAMLGGAMGPATQMAMRILVRMARVANAPALLDIDGAHIDSTVFIGDAGLAYAERLAALGAKVAVPTTLNVSGVDEHHWREWAVPPVWAGKAQRQMAAYQAMGTIPTWTCAPYQTEFKPKFGQQLAWGESNAIAFANSVIGARTERYPDLFDVCCAITGRAPAMGLHLTENRAGQLLLQLSDVPAHIQQRDDFYPVLGHLMGVASHAGDGHTLIPVIDGLDATPSEDQLKSLGAAGACSGAVALFHIVGVTPEAPTRDAAFQGRAPERTQRVTMDDLRAARAELTHAVGAGEDDGALHMVVLGSPHFSLAEFKQLAPLLAGRRRHPAVRFLVTSSRAMTALADKLGVLATLRDFGAQLTVDTCMLTTPMLPPEINRLMTNSAKFAWYAPGLLNKTITYGSLEDCVNSAVAGRIVRDEAAWA
jgi:cis-L-3-hydroxyproline dehydratase